MTTAAVAGPSWSPTLLQYLRKRAGCQGNLGQNRARGCALSGPRCVRGPDRIARSYGLLAGFASFFGRAMRVTSSLRRLTSSLAVSTVIH